MTTETTCLSSIWQTDEKIREFYEIHGRSECYRELAPADAAYYDGCIEVDLSKIRPMIALPFHPSNVFTIEELNANLEDILHEAEENGRKQLTGNVDFKLTDKIKNGKLYVQQGVIGGCAGGGADGTSCTEASARAVWSFGIERRMNNV